MPIPCPIHQAEAWERFLANHNEMVEDGPLREHAVKLARDCCARCSDEREATVKPDFFYECLVCGARMPALWDREPDEMQAVTVESGGKTETTFRCAAHHVPKSERGPRDEALPKR